MLQESVGRFRSNPACGATDPRFIKLFQNSQTFFNCRQCCFTPKYQQLLSLHEGAHAYFAKKAGALDVNFYGPTMYWDSRPKYDKPAISRSAVGWSTPPLRFGLDILKANIAGYICRREMSDTPNESVAIESDIDGAREWFERHVGTGEAGLDVALEIAEGEILDDLKSEAIKAEIWAEAKRFESEIFPTPRLTSRDLKAKRLDWMHAA